MPASRTRPSRPSSSKTRLFLASTAFALIVSAPAFAANIYETLKADPQFSVLVKIIDANGIKSQYTNASPRTVFAPTDAAFAKSGSGGSDMANPGDESTRQNTQALLLYQIVPGKHTEASLKGTTRTFTTLQTGKVQIDGTGSAIHFGDRYGGTVSGPAIEASNGLVYPIDSLPTPVFGEVGSTRPRMPDEAVPPPVIGTPVPTPQIVPGPAPAPEILPAPPAPPPPM